MSPLLEDILRWKTETENSLPPMDDQRFSVTISPNDLTDLRAKLGIPTSVILPGYAGKIFGVEIYVQEEASQ